MKLYYIYYFEHEIILYIIILNMKLYIYYYFEHEIIYILLF